MKQPGVILFPENSIHLHKAAHLVHCLHPPKMLGFSTNFLKTDASKRSKWMDCSHFWFHCYKLLTFSRTVSQRGSADQLYSGNANFSTKFNPNAASLSSSFCHTHFASLVVTLVFSVHLHNHWVRFLHFFICLSFLFLWLLFQMFYLYCTLSLGWYTLLHPLLSCRTHTPMQTSCWRRPSSLPKRASATPRRSTRPPTSSKTGSKTLFAAWSSAKSCWTCLSPSTRTSKR